MRKPSNGAMRCAPWMAFATSMESPPFRLLTELRERFESGRMRASFKGKSKVKSQRSKVKSDSVPEVCAPQKTAIGKGTNEFGVISAAAPPRCHSEPGRSRGEEPAFRLLPKQRHTQPPSRPTKQPDERKCSPPAPSPLCHPDRSRPLSKAKGTNSFVPQA